MAPNRHSASPLKASEEFVIGKHQIGWINSDFSDRFAKETFTERPMPTYQTLARDMTDEEIESELKPGLCELGDVLTFLDHAPQECKDGYANLFYFPSLVVDADWQGRGWDLDAWCRDGPKWRAGGRAVRPA